MTERESLLFARLASVLGLVLLRHRFGVPVVVCRVPVSLEAMDGPDGPSSDFEGAVA